MEELEALANFQCVFEGLGVVILRLAGLKVDGDSGEEDEGEDSGEDEEEDEEEEDVEEEDVEEEDGQDVEAGIHGCGRDPRFANDADEMLFFLECFDSGGAPKRDKRSQAILKRLG
jgi:hypothetical protein